MYVQSTRSSGTHSYRLQTAGRLTAKDESTDPWLPPVIATQAASGRRGAKTHTALRGPLQVSPRHSAMTSDIDPPASGCKPQGGWSAFVGGVCCEQSPGPLPCQDQASLALMLQLTVQLTGDQSHHLPVVLNKHNTLGCSLCCHCRHPGAQCPNDVPPVSCCGRQCQSKVLAAPLAQTL